MDKEQFDKLLTVLSGVLNELSLIRYLLVEIAPEGHVVSKDHFHAQLLMAQEQLCMAAEEAGRLRPVLVNPKQAQPWGYFMDPDLPLRASLPASSEADPQT